MLEAYTTGIEYDGIRFFSPEMRREIYEALRLKIAVASDGTARIQGNADANVIRLTRGAEDYGHAVERYRGQLKVS